MDLEQIIKQEPLEICSPIKTENDIEHTDDFDIPRNNLFGDLENDIKTENTEDHDDFRENLPDAGNSLRPGKAEPLDSDSLDSWDWTRKYGLRRCSVVLTDIAVKWPYPRIATLKSGEFIKYLEPQKKVFKCQSSGCSFSSPWRIRLNLHNAKNHAHTKGLLLCAHCRFSTVYKSNLQAHIFNFHFNSDLPGKLNECSFSGCDFKTFVRSEYIDHLDLKHGQPKSAKKCPYCNHYALYSRGLRNHVLKHLPNHKRAYQCSFDGCGNGFNSKLGYDAHMARHGEKKHLKKCPYCDYAAVRKQALKLHIQTHLPGHKKTFKCAYSDCQYSSAQKAFLFAHLSSHHGEVQHARKCPQCDYYTALVGDMNKHVETHLPVSEKSFKCQFIGCGTNYAQWPQLKAHLAKKHAETKYLSKCPLCNFSTVHNNQLQRHIKRHAPPADDAFQCTHPDCDFKSPRKIKLTLHLASQHGEGKNTEKCPNCGSFTVHINEHLVNDSGESRDIKTCRGCCFSTVPIKSEDPPKKEKKAFQCSYPGCSYGSTGLSYFNRHLVKVHGENKEMKKCPKCNYYTGCARHLEKHVETHLPRDKRSCKCTYPGCSYSCTQKQYLRVHLAKVHNEEKYLNHCNQCSYTTPRSGDLKKHLATHLPDSNKPLQCVYTGCNYNTNHKKQFAVHMANKHGETKNLKQCPHCSFATAGDLKYHLKVHFPDLKPRFHCSYPNCTYSVVNKHTLNRHLGKVHGESDKLKKCSKCAFVTVHDSYLRKHMAVHLPKSEKQNKCTYTGCDYACSTKGVLRSHYALKHGESHLLEKCPHCIFTTARGDLQRHIKKHFSNVKKAFVCDYPVCGFSSETQVGLSIHLATQHGSKGQKLRRCANCVFSTFCKKLLRDHLQICRL